MKTFITLYIVVTALKLDISNTQNLLYTVKSSLGTPRQDFHLSVSVYSPYTWVLEHGCSPCHKAGKAFNPESSSTFSVTNMNPLSFQFNEGIVIGIICSDKVKIGNSEGSSSSFLLVDSDFNIENFNGDGALGLCPSNPFISEFFAINSIPEPIFSVFFSDNGFTSDSTNISSALLIGEYDLKYTRNMDNKTVFTTNCWEFTVNSFALSDFYSEANTLAYLDSSLEYILGPKSDVIKLYQILIDQYKCGIQYQGLLQCNCPNLNNYLDIVFQFNMEYIILTPKQYFLEKDGSCIFLVFYKEGQTFQVWRFGMPLFREYYMVFNVSDNSVQFFRAALSKIEVDDSESIRRWVTITIVVLVITISVVTLYIIYALLCKNPSHRIPN